LQAADQPGQQALLRCGTAVRQPAFREAEAEFPGGSRPLSV